MTLPARLLLVDDDESNRDVLARRLVRRGYHADLAEDGERALDMLENHPYDLVLLDHMMPGISGLDVLRRIRGSWSASALPVIMVTALGESDHIVTALRMGANDYVAKPLDFALVLARIEACLRMSAADRELRRTKELYQLALRAAEEGLWDWDLAGGTVEYSGRWKSMLGFQESEISDQPEEWFARVHPDDRKRVRAAVRAHVEDQTPSLECQYRIQRKDGEYLWIENRGGVLRDARGQAVRLAGCQTDITVRKTIDPLTSLPNRDWLEDELASLAAAGRRIALLLLEFDRFGSIEESLSHGGQARFVAEVAGRFRESLREAVLAESVAPGHAVLARSGERQFAVVLRDATGPAAARELAAHLQAALAQPFEIDRQSIFATASSGIAMTYVPDSGDDLLRDATGALRHAREQGIGQCQIFQTSMRRDDLEKLHLEHDLHLALERSEFAVHYQPKVDLLADEVVGCEALVRWNRPGHGVVSPGSFIPAAERNGLIAPIGRFVLERACRDIADLRRCYPSLQVSVNVSGRQFAEPDLVEHVRWCLDTAGLEASVLCLEITETFLVEDPDQALVALRRLRVLGVGLKLDDFGAGYSSLDYLQRFPFDALKIDRSFVSRLPASPETTEIVRAVLGLARSLHLELVAEGIENRAQLECLRELGCRYGQGYWFSPPVDLESMRGLLEEWRARKAGVESGCLPVGCRE